MIQERKNSMPDERDYREIFLSHFHKNKDKVYDYASRMLGDMHSAGDITQEVFLRLFENRKKIGEIRNVGGWLIVTARNLCLNHLRDRKSEIPIENADRHISNNPTTQNSHLATLEKAMAGLKNKFREALILREYEGFSYHEISEILQITVPAVRSLLYSARIKLSENFHKINNGRLQ